MVRLGHLEVPEWGLAAAFFALVPPGMDVRLQMGRLAEWPAGCVPVGALYMATLAPGLVPPAGAPATGVGPRAARGLAQVGLYFGLVSTVRLVSLARPAQQPGVGARRQRRWPRSSSRQRVCCRWAGVFTLFDPT
jgi:hypothetical protein